MRWVCEQVLGEADAGKWTVAQLGDEGDACSQIRDYWVEQDPAGMVESWAQHYYDEHDGVRHKWPISVALVGPTGERSEWVVALEAVPLFTATSRQ